MTEEGDLSIITSMLYFAGKHPDALVADQFVKSLGFQPLRDPSSTLDDVDWNRGLIIRDCHAGNWIVAGDAGFRSISFPSKSAHWMRRITEHRCNDSLNSDQVKS